MNSKFVKIHIFHFSIPFFQRAMTSQTIPMDPHIIAIFRMSSIFSTGIHTIIFPQRLPPVKILRKVKKKPKNPNNQRILYEISAKHAIIKISVVILMLNAKPEIIHAIAISKKNHFFSILSRSVYQRIPKELTLTIMSAGSSFISFAC